MIQYKQVLPSGGGYALGQRDCSPLITWKPEKESKERRDKPMNILSLIAVLSFGLTCFEIGYSIGNSKTQK